MNITGLVIMIAGFLIMFFGIAIIGVSLFWLLALVVGALICGLGWMVLWSGRHTAKGKNKKTKS